MPKPKLHSKQKAENIFVARQIANAMLAVRAFIYVRSNFISS